MSTLLSQSTSDFRIGDKFNKYGALSGMRACIGRFLYHKYTEVIIAFIAILNFVLIIFDADIEAAGDEPPLWLSASSVACFAAYCFELCLRIYVERLHIFLTSWNWLDMSVVSLGLIEYLLDVIGGVTVFSVRFLRIFRCLRLVRIFKAHAFVQVLRELKLLVRGMLGCVRTLTWSLVLTFIFLTSWSVVAVELVHPLMNSVQESQQVWGDCERCVRSFQTVMGSNLTFFQTIVAGDSWGKVAIPVIEMYPWTGIIFVGTLFTLIFGMLNLVIAVLVDSAAEARAGDTELRARQADDQRAKEKRVLAKIFKKIDLDSSGALTFDELQQGAQHVPEFRDRLKVMAIDDDDLQQMFIMCDLDNSGEVDADEFIETLYRLKCSDHAVAATFVKHYVLHMNRNHQLLQSKVDELFAFIRTQMVGCGEVQHHSESSLNGSDKVPLTEQVDFSNLNGFRGEWTSVPAPNFSHTTHPSFDTVNQAAGHSAWTRQELLPGGLLFGASSQSPFSPPGLPSWRCSSDQPTSIAHSLINEPQSVASQEVTTPRSTHSPSFTPRQVQPPSTDLHDRALGAIEKSLC